MSLISWFSSLKQQLMGYRSELYIKTEHNSVMSLSTRFMLYVLAAQFCFVTALLSVVLRHKKNPDPHGGESFKYKIYLNKTKS